VQIRQFLDQLDLKDQQVQTQLCLDLRAKRDLPDLPVRLGQPVRLVQLAHRV
jgi:hypothetical protein